jgi:hypothetical protein
MATSAFSRALVATAMALTAASAAAAVDVPYTPTPQLASLLCWAATTQMVVDAMNPPHPADPDEPYKIAAQAFLPSNDPDFATRVKACRDDIASCNAVWYPILDKMGFSYLNTGTSVHPAQSLTEDELTAELDNGRLMIFGWLYDSSGGGGLHFMLIAGYHHTAAGKLRLHIFDPMPVNIGSAQTISYDNYTVATPYDLHNDMGLPYAQSFNYYGIHTQAPATSPPSAPSNLEVDGAAGSAGPGTPPAAIRPAPPVPPAPEPPAAARPDAAVGLRAAIEASQPFASKALAEFDAADYSPPHGLQAKLSVGKPFPIVALSLDELRAAAGAPTARLLRRETGVVLYPVIAAGQVRDSFLLIKRGASWIRGGYANTAVTRLLVGQRKQHARTKQQWSSSYLLSVPALGAFFLAQPAATEAMLIPVTSHPAISARGKPLQAGRAYQAKDVLTGLIEAAVRFRPARLAAPELKLQ